jgi:hypothetical protein
MAFYTTNNNSHTPNFLKMQTNSSLFPLNVPSFCLSPSLQMLESEASFACSLRTSRLVGRYQGGQPSSDAAARPNRDTFAERPVCDTTGNGGKWKNRKTKCWPPKKKKKKGGGAEPPHQGCRREHRDRQVQLQAQANVDGRKEKKDVKTIK